MIARASINAIVVRDHLGSSMPSNILLACVFVGLTYAVPAQTTSSIESAGIDVAIALPVAAGGITLWKEDWTGTA